MFKWLAEKTFKWLKKEDEQDNKTEVDYFEESKIKRNELISILQSKKLHASFLGLNIKILDPRLGVLKPKLLIERQAYHPKHYYVNICEIINLLNNYDN
jgi:hypothetical protein